MLHLLILEWKKLTSNRTFIVMSILYVVFLPSIFFLGKFLPNLDGESSGMNATAMATLLEDPYIFPHIWKALSYLGNWFNYYFLGLIGILIITNEYDYKTLRQSIINGLTRREFFVGKILIVFAVSCGFALYYMLLGLLIGYFNTDYIVWAKVTQHADIIPKYALQIMGYMSLAVFFGWVFRRFALSLIFYLFYPIIEYIFLSMMLYYFKLTYVPMMYLPISAMKNLVPVYTPSPMINAGLVQLATEYETQVGIPYYLPATDATIVSAVFIIIFIGLSYLRFMKSDL